MSYTFLLEQGEESSAASFSDIPASVLSRLNLTAETSCSNGSGTEFFPGFQSGMTSEHSMASHGVGELTLCAGGSHAKTSALPGGERESMASAVDYGDKWPGSSVKLDRASRSWKIHQPSLFGDWVSSFETWPKWGMMRNGECLELSMPERLIGDYESGLWVGTPTQCDAVGTVGRSEKFKTKTPTPTEFVKMWPTPVASSAGQGKNPTDRGLKLQTAVRMWPTPTSRDHKDTGDSILNGTVPVNSLLGRAVGPSVAGGALNPPWVEWLMGWPIGWTDLEPLGMDKFRQWLSSHGKP